jgi:hypothetical protein
MRGVLNMSRIPRLIIWICKKFDRVHIEKIIQGLIDALKDPNSEINAKDRFKEEHPNYRDFHVDQNEPLQEKPGIKKKRRKTTRKF